MHHSPTQSSSVPLSDGSSPVEVKYSAVDLRTHTLKDAIFQARLDIGLHVDAETDFTPAEDMLSFGQLAGLLLRRSGG